MNMKHPVCNEMTREHNIRTEWHHDDLHDAQRLDEAWNWLCESRKTAPANADIWDLRHCWPAYRETFLRQLQSGAHRLSPMLVVGAHRQEMWSAEDALALKWVALSITPSIPVHEKCEHVKGHGGGKLSILRVSHGLTENDYRWVIKGYYGAIRKETLLLQLRQHITRTAYLTVLTQYIHYSVEEGGQFFTPANGIARGCALSPLMGALHLWAVDNYFAHQHKIYYGRYMDDFVILTHSRWQLRKQVKQLNKYLASLGFEKHPDKTFIGKVCKGFDWMGAWLTDKGAVGIAPRALANHREKIRRLYEQTRRWSEEKQARRVSDYRNRWKIWVGLFCVSTTLPAWAIVLHPGETSRVPVNVSWAPTSGSDTPAANSSNGNHPAGSFAIWSSTLGTAGNYCLTAEQFALHQTQTSDGYYGLEIAPDVVMGLTGTADGPRTILTGGEITSGTWDEYGKFSGSANWCGNPGPLASYVMVFDPQPSYFSGTYFIHAGPNAQVGTYNHPHFVLSRIKPSSGWGGARDIPLHPSGSVQIKKHTSCTVSVTPASVSFGTRPSNELPGTVLASGSTQILTNCDAVDDGGDGSERTSVTLSAQGTYDTSPDRLALLSDDGVTSLAWITGKTGASSCAQPDEYLHFDGSPMAFGTVGMGLNSTEMFWALCANGENRTGAGTANAVLTIEWP